MTFPETGERPIRFDDAWAHARSVVEAHPQLAGNSHVVLVRDLYGKVRLALDDRADVALASEVRADLLAAFDQQLGAFSPGRNSLLLLASEMFAPEEVFGAADALAADPSRGAAGGYRLLERSVVGADWLRVPFAPAGRTVESTRLTLYGIKGGVGRSTAATILAWRLARAGRRVLVLDLDLESPGVGSTLLPATALPDFGIADWFVEDNVGQADDELLREMAGPSPLGAGGAELLVVPAGGRRSLGAAYLAKLARTYLDATHEGHLETFGDRLHRMVTGLETLYRPDVTLLDSRAGLHDIAAVAVTRLGALSLLFAVDSAQTWQAYEALFATWKTHFERAALFRDRLQMVAAQVPETETPAYLTGFRQRAYDLFAEHLYVETPAGEESEFNFGLDDPEAPHTPLRIHWSRSFQAFDPAAVTEEQIRAAFGDFLQGVGELVFGEGIP
jgi:hypothetical protein